MYRRFRNRNKAPEGPCPAQLDEIFRRRAGLSPTAWPSGEPKVLFLDIKDRMMQGIWPADVRRLFKERMVRDMWSDDELEAGITWAKQLISDELKQIRTKGDYCVERGVPGVNNSSWYSIKYRCERLEPRDTEYMRAFDDIVLVEGLVRCIERGQMIRKMINYDWAKLNY